MIRKLILGLLGVTFGLAGCVSTKAYKKSQAETATCLTDKQAQAQTLQQQIDALNKEKAALVQSEADKEAELAKLKGTYDQVVGDLKNEISSGQIQVTQLKDKLTLNMVEKILFNSGQAEVKDSGKKVLDSIAAALKNVQDKDIRVEGYTDNVALSPKLKDRFPTNWELSTARATNVVRYLEEKDGLDPSHLIAAGFGQYHPLSTNDTPEGRAQNRRIDIVLVPHEVSGSAAQAHVTQAAAQSGPAAVETSTPTAPSPAPQGSPNMGPAQ
jgi:chemotaxis protein MotB